MSAHPIQEPTSTVESPNDGVSELIRESQAGFRRDLPALLKDRRLRGQWVAYQRDRRVGVGRSKHQLYQQCVKNGLVCGEFVVRLVAPEWEEEIELPVEV